MTGLSLSDAWVLVQASFSDDVPWKEVNYSVVVAAAVESKAHGNKSTIKRS